MSLDWGSLLGAGMTMYRDTRRPAGQTPYYLESPVSSGMGASSSASFDPFTAGRRRHRRMNPMNARAARRAVRRLKSVRKLLQSIERGMPKRTVHASSPFRRRRRS